MAIAAPAVLPVGLPADLITYDDAASILGANNQHVRYLVTRKRLRSYHLPGYKHKFLSRAQVERLKNGESTSLDDVPSPPISREDYIRAIARQELEQQLTPLYEQAEEVTANTQEARRRLAAAEAEEERFRKVLSVLRRRAQATA